MIILIAAINKHRTIGLNGSMPWHNREDLQHFKETTLHQTVVMGRKTFDGLPRKLVERDVYVVTRDDSYENAIPDLRAFLLNASKSDHDIYIAGGGEVYAQALPFADQLLISYIQNDVVGDTFFPEISEREFKIISQKQFSDFKLVKYERIRYNDNC